MEVEVMNAKRDKNASFVRGMSLNTIVVAVGLIGLGVFWSINHDGCGNILTPPLIGIGAALFIISIIGFLGALKYNPILLWIYLVFLGFIFTVLLVLTVMGFIVTSHDPGHPVDGLRYKEYRLQDCSSWLRKRLNNHRTWENFKSCFVVPSGCGVLSKIYGTPEQYKLAELDLIHAGCCRPPSECGYPVINASYYNLSIVSMSSHKDCKLYKNFEAIKCFDCDSCKAGVAQYLNLMWRWSLIDFVVFLFVLILLIKCVCSVRRNAEKARLRRVYVFPNDVLQERV